MSRTYLRFNFLIFLDSIVYYKIIFIIQLFIVAIIVINIIIIVFYFNFICKFNIKNINKINNFINKIYII